MKILIVKTSSLGDIIQSFPVLSYLKKCFPHAEIDWAVESVGASLVLAHPDVSRALILNTKKWRKSLFSAETLKEVSAFRKNLRQTVYDIVFDLQGNCKSSFVLFQTKSREKVGFGRRYVAEWPNLLFTSKKIIPPKGQNIREDYLAVAKECFNDKDAFIPTSVELKISQEEHRWFEEFFYQTESEILVCPGAAWPNKQLSDSSLISVLKTFESKSLLFAWGTEEERKRAFSLASYFPKSRLLEKVSLPLLQHVMARCSLVIAMDSLPLHLCGTTNTPTLSWFGPSSAHKYKPLGDKHIVIQGSCPYGITFEKRCPKLRSCKTGACIKSLADESPLCHLVDTLADQERSLQE